MATNETLSLLIGSSWTPAGQSATITYTVQGENQINQFGGIVEVVNQEFLTAANAAIKAFSDVANIKFNYISSDLSNPFAPTTVDANLTFSLGFLEGTTIGEAQSTTFSDLGTPFQKVDLILNNLFFSPTDLLPSPTSEGFATLLHELGHGVGLAHPNEGAAFGSIFGSDFFIPAVNLDGSLMNEISSTFGTQTAIAGQPLGPQIYDIAALQHLYGANTSFNSGNDTYTFSGYFAKTIWDGGGVDTIDQSAITIDMVIDLREGINNVTEVGAARIWNAVGANIENANGGTVQDTINGNAISNVLNGRAGNDIINGNGANDIINGNQGIDVVNGNAGDDIVRGGRDNDIVRGGQGNDQVFGDLGNDVIYGDLGNDSLYGGTGADIFVFNANSGIDWIYDFESTGITDVIQISVGVIGSPSDAVAATSFSDGNAIVDLGGGNQIILAGITNIATDDFGIIA